MMEVIVISEETLQNMVLSCVGIQNYYVTELNE